MADKFPISTAITFGRKFTGPEATPTDDWHISISGYTELYDSADVYRVSMGDIHVDLSKLIHDPEVAEVFPKVYSIVQRIIKGELQPIEETPNE